MNMINYVTGIFNISLQIHCVVGIKKFKNMFPCYSTPSQLFFVGIEVFLLILPKKTAKMYMFSCDFVFMVM